jgi:hypothetical protein
LVPITAPPGEPRRDQPVTQRTRIRRLRRRR